MNPAQGIRRMPQNANKCYLELEGWKAGRLEHDNAGCGDMAM
jgi:hypothetical protein